MSAGKKMVYFVRHGQSTFNEASHVGELYPNANLKSRFFVDADLTPTGEQQALKAEKNIRDLNIEVAIASPFRRALRTCQLAYGEENVIVNQWCGERFESMCDIGSDMAHLKELFPVFDFRGIPNVWWYTAGQNHKTAMDSIKWFSGLPYTFHEPNDHLMFRIEQFHSFLQSRGEKSIAVFSHSMFLKRFLNVYFERPINEVIPNCKVISYSL